MISKYNIRISEIEAQPPKGLKSGVGQIWKQLEHNRKRAKIEVFTKWHENSQKEDRLCQGGDIQGKLHKAEEI